MMARPTIGDVAPCIVVGLLGAAACSGGSRAMPVTTPIVDAGDGGRAGGADGGAEASAEASTEAISSEADAVNDGPAPSLSTMLVRDWFSDTGQGGNCINVASWYSFGADG